MGRILFRIPTRYGKSIVYSSDPYPSTGALQPSKVIFSLDKSKFDAFYVDMLTRPVPVTFGSEPVDENTAVGGAVSPQ
jgi:hypothetical protein